MKDLALVKVVGFSKKYQSVELGQLIDVEIGDEVHVIGHPVGGMFWSYTKGNISGYVKGYEWKGDGQKYNQILMNPWMPSSQSVYYKTKNLDKAKEVKLRLVHRKYKKVVDFIEELT